MKKNIILTICCLFLSLPAYGTVYIDRLVVFGDSLSDTGNLYQQTRLAHATVPSLPIVPVNPPYWNGRFSNGYNWIDYLNQALGSKLSNYAMGGSWVESKEYSHQDYPMSLYSEVTYYKSLSWWDTHTKDHLYVVFAGANDYITERRDDVEGVTDRVVAGIKKQVESLIHWGGRYFLIPNLPNLSISPFATYPEYLEKNGEDWGRLLKRYEEVHDQKLSEMIDRLRAEYPDKIFVLADAVKLFDDIITAPQNFGFTHAIEACYPGSNGYSKRLAAKAVKGRASESKLPATRLNLKNNWVIAQAAGGAVVANRKAQSFGLPLNITPCSDPENYVFWDLVHPTTRMHLFMARLAVDALQAQGIGVRTPL